MIDLRLEERDLELEPDPNLRDAANAAIPEVFPLPDWKRTTCSFFGFRSNYLQFYHIELLEVGLAGGRRALENVQTFVPAHC